MAVISGVGPLHPHLKTSAADPLCERVNQVAWRSIWPVGVAIGASLGGLITWVWSFNPLLAIPITLGLALFVSAAYFLFQWPLEYDVEERYEVLEDTVTQQILRDPWIALSCGHTADAQSAFGFVNTMGKCTVSCEQELGKQDFVPNRLIIGLLNALHGKKGGEADVAFRTFVERHKDESMVLPDGRSCNLLGAVLSMRARLCTESWDDFCQINRDDLYRGTGCLQFRVGVNAEGLQAVLGTGGDFDEKLEDLYKQSTYNKRWQRVVDKYMEEEA